MSLQEFTSHKDRDRYNLKFYGGHQELRHILPHHLARDILKHFIKTLWSIYLRQIRNLHFKLLKHIINGYYFSKQNEKLLKADIKGDDSV